MTTIGVLGGGQLGRMLALAGLPLGLRFRFLDPSAAPAAAAVGEHVRGSFSDPGALARFAEGLDVVTYEFEHIDPHAVHWLGERLHVRPGPRALLVGRDRVEEKRFMQSIGARVADFSEVRDRSTLLDAFRRVGAPAILKTRDEGYDGRGQAAIGCESDLEAAWMAIGERPAVLERRIPFQRELAIIGVRGLDGSMRRYPLVETQHTRGVLTSALAPAPQSNSALEQQADVLMQSTLQALDYVGVLTIECFEHEGSLMVNEIAPRVHNSGHWTIEGAVTSQFENHLRAITGLPLGSTEARGHSGMLNLLGGIPPLAEILAPGTARAHLYGKTPQPGRKVGHITFNAPAPTLVLERMRHMQQTIEAHHIELEGQAHEAL